MLLLKLLWIVVILSPKLVACINLRGYNEIPNFDFPANSLDQGYKVSSVPDIDCNTNPVCAGFNSAGEIITDLNSPQTSNKNFYVHQVIPGIKFVELIGLDFLNGDMAYMPLVVSSTSECAYQCSIVNDCVGAVSDGANICRLKSSFSKPFESVTSNMLIPVGKDYCPLSLLSTGKCIDTNVKHSLFLNINHRYKLSAKPTYEISQVSFRIYGMKNKCIDIPQNNQNVSQRLQLYDCKLDSESQSFTIMPISGSSVNFNIKATKGLCVSVKDNSTSDGASLELNSCNGHLNQAFLVDSVSGFEPYQEIKPLHTLSLNKCIDSSGDENMNGNVIQIWDCNSIPTDIYWVLSFAVLSAGNISILTLY